MTSLTEIQRLVEANLDEYIRWPKKALLLWHGCCRRKYHEYPDAILTALRANRISVRNWGNDPAIHSFLLAGGERPKRKGNNFGWNIHHLYFGCPFPGRNNTIHAVKEPLHFTQSAGLVAIHPVAEGLAEEEPQFTWSLREHAFKRFGYDPDCFFSPDQRHDELGFVKPYASEVLFKGN